MALSRSSLAQMQGDAMSDLIGVESGFGGIGDPLGGARGRSRTRRVLATRVSARSSRGRSGSLAGLRQRLPGLSRAGLSSRGFPGRRRRRGISAAQLRGFRRVVRLLHSIGMQPKKLRVRRSRT